MTDVNIAIIGGTGFDEIEDFKNISLGQSVIALCLYRFFL